VHIKICGILNIVYTIHYKYRLFMIIFINTLAALYKVIYMEYEGFKKNPGVGAQGYSNY
jgi:hypothetical protein